MTVVKQKYILSLILGVLCSTPFHTIAEVENKAPNTSTPQPEATQANPEISNPFSASDSEFSLDIEDVELIFQTQVERLILGDTFGIQKSNITYIGLQTLFDILDFPIRVDIENKTAEGWFISESNHFSIKRSGIKSTPIFITAKQATHPIEKEDVLFKEDDIYIETNTIFNIFEMAYEINTNALTLKLMPIEPLPIQKKLARKKRKAIKRTSLNAVLPQKRRPYQLWSNPFIDAQTRYSKNSAGFDTFSYSALGAGDLAYMTGTYYAQGDKDDNLKYFRMTLSRDSIKSNLLGPLKATHFSFGEINPNAGGGVGNAGQEVGARISNRPFGRNFRLQQTDFLGDTQPGWDVELYRNNIFLGGQTVGENGRYEFFNQEILSGENTFKLVFYGPQGQQHEKTEQINLTQAGLETGKLLYDISLSNQHSRLFELRDDFKAAESESRRFNVNLFNDVNEYISLQGSYSRYTFRDGTTHNFFKPAARLFVLNTLLFVNAIKDINGGYSTYYSLSKSFWRQTLSYSNTKSSADYFIESSELEKAAQSTQSVNLSGLLIKSKYLRFNYGLDASRNVVENTSTKDSLGFNFAARALSITLSNNLTYSETTPEGSIKTRSLNGTANVSRSIFRFNLRGGASYTLEPVKDVKLKRVSKLSGNISWRMFSRIRSQYSYNYSPINDISSHAMSVNWRTKKFTLTSNFTRSNNGAYSVYAGVNFSLSYDKNTSRFNLWSNRIARRGAISARIYIDDNNNGVQDADEPAIKGAKIRAEQARRQGKTAEDGTVFFPGLPVDRLTDVELAQDSIEDPFLVSSNQGYSFIPRPGVIESLDIPLVISGEIEGTVHIENKNKSTRPGGYVPLQLTNIKTRQTRSVITAYDGFYLFSQIPPGEYLVAIDKSYLKRNKFGAYRPMPRLISIQAGGAVEMGNDFTLFSLTETATR